MLIETFFFAPFGELSGLAGRADLEALAASGVFAALMLPVFLTLSQMECARWGVPLKSMPTKMRLILMACAALLAILLSGGETNLQPSWAAIMGLLAALLVALAYTDHRSRLLPDSLTVLLAVLGLAFHLVHTNADVFGHVIAALICAGFLWGFEALFHRYQQSAIGRGDLMLVAALGIWMGFEKLLFILAIASALAVCVVLVNAMLGRFQRSQTPSTSHILGKEIAFGPALCLAMVITWSWDFPVI